MTALEQASAQYDITAFTKFLGGLGRGEHRRQIDHLSVKFNSS